MNDGVGALLSLFLSAGMTILQSGMWLQHKLASFSYFRFREQCFILCNISLFIKDRSPCEKPALCPHFYCHLVEHLDTTVKRQGRNSGWSPYIQSIPWIIKPKPYHCAHLALQDWSSWPDIYKPRHWLILKIAHSSQSPHIQNEHLFTWVYLTVLSETPIPL